MKYLKRVVSTIPVTLINSLKHLRILLHLSTERLGVKDKSIYKKILHYGGFFVYAITMYYALILSDVFSKQDFIAPRLQAVIHSPQLVHLE